MKKLLLSVAILLGAASGANAQIADGSIAPNFTFTDTDGNTHTLYDYLDAGQSVVLDLFAVWCQPCWNYAQTGVLDQVYNTYGPAGTGEMMVFSVEADPSTAAAEILGGGSSIGDWTTVVGNPIGDSPSIASAYELAYYPTIFLICPNRIVKEVGQLSSAGAFYSQAGQCESANGTNNGALLDYTGETITCGGDVNFSVRLQNMGTANLTACTIDVMDGATTVLSYPWTGNLATYDVATVNLGSAAVTTTTTYTIAITSADDNASDNTLSQTITAAQETNQMITIDVHTDNYADEIYIEITNSSGAVVWTEGNENVDGDYCTGQFPPAADPTNALQNDTDYSWDVTLPVNDCYTITWYDYYGDGLGAGGTGAGYDVRDANGTILYSESAANWGCEEAGLVKSVVGINELDAEMINVYPNPAVGQLNVSFNAIGSDYAVALVDLQGRTVATEIFTGVSGAQKATFGLNGMASGSYIVKVTSETGVYTNNVVVK